MHFALPGCFNVVADPVVGSMLLEMLTPNITKILGQDGLHMKTCFGFRSSSSQMSWVVSTASKGQIFPHSDLASP